MRPVRALLVCASAVLLWGCEGAKAPTAPKVNLLEQSKAKLEPLVVSLGEDAYLREEVAQILRDLAEIPADSPDKKEALELVDFLRAKRQIAHDAMNAPPPARPTPDSAPAYGPVAMPGPRPTTEVQLEQAKKIKVGATREELAAALGSCLVRQTWFQGRNGGPTVELFHTEKGCRGALEARIYRVSGGLVDEIKPGTLDGIMEPAAPAPESYNE